MRKEGLENSCLTEHIESKLEEGSEPFIWWAYVNRSLNEGGGKNADTQEIESCGDSWPLMFSRDALHEKKDVLSVSILTMYVQ